MNGPAGFDPIAGILRTELRPGAGIDMSGGTISVITPPDGVPYVAGDGVFPEFDHNELEGWAGDTCKTNLPVFIRTKADGETAKYMDACKDVIKKWGVDPLIINIPGETHMESIMYGIILGDYVSLYVAELQKKDPSPVDAITEFKNVMMSRKQA